MNAGLGLSGGAAFDLWNKREPQIGNIYWKLVGCCVQERERLGEKNLAVR